MFNCAGTRPENIGLQNGKLIPCPESPNCVHSQMDKSDSHYMEAIKYSKDLKEAVSDLRSVIQKMPRTNLVLEKEAYFHFEFTSKLMGYVDDVEFYFDDLNKNIHFRSASRLGKSDLGVNRKRIESIKQDLKY
jgi:uncharacterized protein (DUF1499 family)